MSVTDLLCSQLYSNVALQKQTIPANSNWLHAGSTSHSDGHCRSAGGAWPWLHRGTDRDILMTTPRGRLSHGREWVTTWHAVPINSFQPVYHARCPPRRSRHTCWCVSVCLYTPYLTPIVEFWRFFHLSKLISLLSPFKYLTFSLKLTLKYRFRWMPDRPTAGCQDVASIGLEVK